MGRVQGKYQAVGLQSPFQEWGPGQIYNYISSEINTTSHMRKSKRSKNWKDKQQKQPISVRVAGPSFFAQFHPSTRKIMASPLVTRSHTPQILQDNQKKTSLPNNHYAPLQSHLQDPLSLSPSPVQSLQRVETKRKSTLVEMALEKLKKIKKQIKMPFNLGGDVCVCFHWKGHTT